MTSRDVIENKISSTRKYLGVLERYKGYSKAQVYEDIDLKGAVERYPYLAAQSAIDLAEALITFKNLRKPTTMAESFRILQEAGMLPAELAENLVRMTGFRNILAHAYEDVDPDILYDVLQKRLTNLAEFLDKISLAY
jgi:uncharacterized protein YutE (UPF0331/DUF86 family)